MINSDNDEVEYLVESKFSMIYSHRKYIFILLYPTLLSILLITIKDEKAKAAYVFLLMAGFWITNQIPVYVTGLIPLFFGPVLGLVPASEICLQYMNNSIVLLISGCFLAAAMEYRHLHRRIAVIILRFMGGDPRAIFLSMMLPTWFLSMWMSNTSATQMMITIVEAILVQINIDEDSEVDMTICSDENISSDTNKNIKELKNFKTGLSLAICYSANCGGIATLIGSAPNALLYGLLTNSFGNEVGLNFGTWMVYALPISTISLIIIWFVLCIKFIGPRKLFTFSKLKDSISNELNSVIEIEQKNLGPMTFAEKAVMVIFFLTIFLWITREPGVPGWSYFMKSTTVNSKTINYVTDSQIGILGGILMFIFPAYNIFRKKKNRETRKEFEKQLNEPLLPWKVAEKATSWNLILLVGGGFALGKISGKTGLSNYIGDKLKGLKNLPTFLIVYIITLTSTFLTEIISNTATAAILMPILIELANTIKINPLILALPVTVGVSLAFILPAATPPNAIVFDKGRVSLKDMMSTGFILNMVTQMCVIIGTYTYGIPLFKLNTYPAWASKTKMS